MEGTKPYRKKNSPAPSAVPQNIDEKKLVSEEKSTGDAVNLERRAWFGSIVPAFGEGLVKLLRASNNLKDDLRELRGESPSPHKDEK